MTTPSDSDYRIIPLKGEFSAIVDASDYEWLAQWKWRPQRIKNTNRAYVLRTDPKTMKTIYMHQQITNFCSRVVDHRNGNQLDNRRSNLRPCTYTQNSGNRKVKASTKSGFKGVSWDANRYIWDAWFSHRRVGSSSDPAEAAKMYDKAALEYFGEFALLNFR